MRRGGVASTALAWCLARPNAHPINRAARGGHGLRMREVRLTVARRPSRQSRKTHHAQLVAGPRHRKSAFPGSRSVARYGILRIGCEGSCPNVAAGAESLRSSVGRRQTSSPNDERKPCDAGSADELPADHRRAAVDRAGCDDCLIICLRAMEISNRSAPAEHRNNN
jgi:hypothetical protein